MRLTMKALQHKCFQPLWVVFVLIILTAAPTCVTGRILLKTGAYEGITVTIADNVPAQNCKNILNNLEASLTDTSNHLFTALDGRVYFHSININLPGSWPDSCAPGGMRISAATSNTADMTILARGTVSGGTASTQQTAGCGEAGDQIYIAYESLENFNDALGRILVKEWAKYRYGVFDEIGYDRNPIYPICYYDDRDKTEKVTGCSDFPIEDHGICGDPSMVANITKIIDSRARTSIMFAAEAPTVSMFCDDGNHNKYVPTKHNSMCNGRSVLDVILKHKDFHGNNTRNVTNQESVDTRPAFYYTKNKLTRYVLIVEDTKDMSVRESWSFLRSAIRKWAVYDLPGSTEVGLVLANDSAATQILKLSGLNDPSVRDLVASNIPYSPDDSRTPACLKCAIEGALQMLNDREIMNGPASSVILLIAPGMDYTMNSTLITKAIDANVRISVINYPGIFRPQSLDSLAEKTNGVSFTVFEEKYNMANSLLSTYFKLTNAMYAITSTYYEGSLADFPVEIHRREILDDGRNSVTGSFMLTQDVGEPARFSVFTHNTEQPLIRGIKLISPSQIVYSSRSDSLLSVKLLSVPANINETGTWTYTIERFSGNPQPHYVQVFATPRSANVNVIRSKFWVKRIENSSIVVLYAEVKQGAYSVMKATVEVTVSRMESNGTERKERFELLDTGSGDPDLMKDDGVYTRYYYIAGSGTYTFECYVSDNGNAYIRQEHGFTDIPSIISLSPFQRVLPPVTISVSSDNLPIINPSVGRIGDLRAESVPNEFKVRLIWTAPDLGGRNVARYEIKYATFLEDITEKYETAAVMWDINSPFPLATGSETTFTLDIGKEPSLLDKTLYFAMRSFSMISPNAQPSPVSNWVRVHVSSPPPPSTISPTFESPDLTSWQYSENDVETVIPRIATRLDIGLELIIPIIGGVLLLAVLLAVYCYFCILKRKNGNTNKKPVKHASDKITSGISIVPQSANSPSGHVTTPTHTYVSNEVSDHHTIGLPLNYEDEPKKRYSIVNQQEQVIDELKQQHMHQQQRELMQTPNNNHGNLSVISNNTLQRNGRTLSPYESWTASQLLVEHERRHSPMDDLMTNGQPVHDLTTGGNVDHLSMNGQNVDHMSLNGQDIISINGQTIMNPVSEHYNPNTMVAPPVPPLPTFNGNGYPVNYTIYGTHQNIHQQPSNHSVYQVMHRNGTLVPFNPSLQGSLNSVNSGEKKRRNVTMV